MLLRWRVACHRERLLLLLAVERAKKVKREGMQKRVNSRIKYWLMMNGLEDVDGDVS